MRQLRAMTLVYQIINTDYQSCLRDMEDYLALVEVWALLSNILVDIIICNIEDMVWNRLII